MIRIEADSISQTSRLTQGVRLIRLEEDSRVSTVALIDIDPELDGQFDQTNGE